MLGYFRRRRNGLHINRKPQSHSRQDRLYHANSNPNVVRGGGITVIAVRSLAKREPASLADAGLPKIVSFLTFSVSQIQKKTHIRRDLSLIRLRHSAKLYGDRAR